jgi:hypothetical protein
VLGRVAAMAADQGAAIVVCCLVSRTDRFGQGAG